jgi:hypothetical protein
MSQQVVIPLADFLPLTMEVGGCVTDATELLEAKDRHELKAGVELLCQRLEHVLEQISGWAVAADKEGVR